MRATDADSIIVDRDMLSDTFLPGTLIARDAQVAHLQRWLGTAVETRSPVYVWLYGPSGAGKTAAALRVVNQLQEARNVESALINCWTHASYFEVLDALTAEFRILRAEQHRSSHKLEKISRHLTGKPCVIIMDEVDRMKPAERSGTLYNLARLGAVSLVCISNDHEALHGLDDRVRSRLNPATIHFPAYQRQELAQVLHARAEHGLRTNAASRRALEAIAALADGDARVGIGLLRNAAQAADQKGEHEIAAQELERRAHELQQATHAHRLASLTDDHRILYQILERFGQLTSAGLRKAYLHRCAETGRQPLAPRTFFNYAQRLVEGGFATRELARTQGREWLFRIVR